MKTIVVSDCCQAGVSSRCAFDVINNQAKIIHSCDYCENECRCETMTVPSDRDVIQSMVSIGLVIILSLTLALLWLN